MARPEQFGFPLMIAAAVGTVYLLFRRSPAVVSSQNSPVINMPALGGLPTQFLFMPGQSPALSAEYLTTATADPLASDPFSDTQSTPPGYITYNTTMPSFPELLDQMGGGGGSDSDHGGGCGCSACSGPPCKSGVYANAGRSVCLSGSPVKDPTVPITGYAISSFYENNYGAGFGSQIPELSGSL